MRVYARSIVALLLIAILVSVSSCRGGRAHEDDPHILELTDGWSELEVFGFASAAFSLLLDDAEIGIRSARRATVKELATQMQRDYRLLAIQLDSLSAQRSVDLSSFSGLGFTTRHRVDASDLRKEGRRPFDERYLDHVVTGHQRIMDRMYEALSAAQDEPVRQLLEDAQRRLEANVAEAARLKIQAAGGAAGRRS